MCLGIPRKVIELLTDRPDLAHVEVAGLTRPVHVGLLQGESLKPGDWVLIHAGFAMEKIDEATAVHQLAFLQDCTEGPPEPPPPPPWTLEE